MNGGIPRLRMFAGPNGSGKSTIKDVVPSALVGVYVNADEVEYGLKSQGTFDPSRFGLELSCEDIGEYLRHSALLQRVGWPSSELSVRSLSNGLVDFSRVEIHSYLASVLVDLVRRRLLAKGVSFTFETVMSSPDKVEFLREAQAKGYRTYLYFIATEDPDINVSRVASRVKRGGHGVPIEKIVSRYHRSLALLLEAVSCADRAFVFDNSGETRMWIAEILFGKSIEMKTQAVPDWFHRAVLAKLESPKAPLAKDAI